MAEDRPAAPPTRSSKEYAKALRRIREAPASDLVQAVLTQTALASLPVLLYIGGPATAARLLLPKAAWRDLPRLKRLGKVCAYAAGVVARPVGWAAIAGVAEVLAEDQLRIGVRFDGVATGADTTASQAVTGALAGAVVALGRDASRTLPARILGAVSPVAGVVWYAALGAAGGVVLPAVRYVLSHKGANLLAAGGHGIDLGIGQAREGEGAAGTEGGGGPGAAAGDGVPSVMDIEALLEEADREMRAGRGRERE